MTLTQEKWLIICKGIVVMRWGNSKVIMGKQGEIFDVLFSYITTKAFQWHNRRHCCAITANGWLIMLLVSTRSTTNNKKAMVLPPYGKFKLETCNSYNRCFTKSPKIELAVHTNNTWWTFLKLRDLMKTTLFHIFSLTDSANKKGRATADYWHCWP